MTLLADSLTPQTELLKLQREGHYKNTLKFQTSVKKIFSR